MSVKSLKSLLVRRKQALFKILKINIAYQKVYNFHVRWHTNKSKLQKQVKQKKLPLKLLEDFIKKIPLWNSDTKIKPT